MAVDTKDAGEMKGTVEIRQKSMINDSFYIAVPSWILGNQDVVDATVVGLPPNMESLESIRDTRGRGEPVVW